MKKKMLSIMLVLLMALSAGTCFAVTLDWNGENPSTFNWTSADGVNTNTSYEIEEMNDSTLNVIDGGTAILGSIKMARYAGTTAHLVVGNGSGESTLTLNEILVGRDGGGVGTVTIGVGGTLTVVTPDWGDLVIKNGTIDLVGGTLRVLSSYTIDPLYLAKIIGHHGQGTVISEVVGDYTVYTSTTTGTTVDAGNDVNTFLFHGIRDLTMNGSVISDGSTVNSWTFTKDPVDCNDPTFSVPADALDVTVTFTDPGTYTLTLTADDGESPVSDSLVVTVAPRNPEFLKDHFESLQATWTDNSTTVINIVSGPEAILMNRFQTPGKQWIAESGQYQFKLSIEDAVTSVTIDDLVSILEGIPEPYMRACKEVSDDGEQGVAIYADLDGAAGHGNVNYINMKDGATGPMTIAHEMGHTLSILAWNTNPDIGDWTAAIAADEVSISPYGDWQVWEDAAEFSMLYAICLGSGSEYLDELYSLSPARFDIWEAMLYDDNNCAYDETVARTIGDTNYDCKVNLVDFAAMALNWLTDVSLQSSLF